MIPNHETASLEQRRKWLETLRLYGVAEYVQTILRGEYFITEEQVAPLLTVHRGIERLEAEGDARGAINFKNDNIGQWHTERQTLALLRVKASWAAKASPGANARRAADESEAQRQIDRSRYMVTRANELRAAHEAEQMATWRAEAAAEFDATNPPRQAQPQIARAS